MKKVILVLADGFEQSEALVPHDMLKRAGADILTVSVNDKREALSTHGIKVLTDLVLSELPPAKDIDLIILPGGMPGASNIEKSAVICDLVTEVNRHGGRIAAICAAPYIIGHLGILSGRRATCYPGFENELIGASVADTSGGGLVITDGSITTASGMGVALKFGAELVALLYGNDVSAKILKGIMS